MARASTVPAWFAPAIIVTGVVVVLSALVVLKSPTSSPLNPS